MSTSLDLPCLPSHAASLEDGLSVTPIPGAAYTIIVPTDHGLITLDLAILDRCEMMASKAYYGDGWRRIEHGMVAIAIRAEAGPAATSCGSCALVRPSARPDPSA